MAATSKNKDSSSEKIIGTANSYINDAFALVDEKNNEDYSRSSIFFQNMQRIKISIAAVSKYTNDLSKQNLIENTIWLDYNLSVLNLTLRDSISSLGMGGSIIMHNTGSFADIILHRHDGFYIVINFSIIEEGDIVTKLEPYIFEIANVENLSPPDEENKKIKLELVDIMTAICSKHNIATLIKMSGGTITKKTSYKAVFEEILNYIKDHIRTNFLNKYSYRKDLYFTDIMKLNSNYDVDEKRIESDSDENDNLSELVKASFKKMPQDATILDAIRILSQDCGRTLKTPSQFSMFNQTAGDLIIPFFFKEEYQYNTYYEYVWQEPEQSSISSSLGNLAESIFDFNFNNVISASSDFLNSLSSIRMTQNQYYGGTATRLVYRNMTMRDIWMPFYLAFADKKNTTENNSEKYIFESINPEKNKNGEFTENELLFKTIPGYRHDAIIHGIQSFPHNSEDVKKRWKNIVFVDVTNGTSSVLIFLRWFYNYFCSVFLNNNPSGAIQYVPNLLPAFLAKSFKYGVGEAEEGDTFDTKYDIHNSNIFICKTTDSRNETMREMGKNVASLILSNNRYVLKLDGNLFRRPNEIIKFSQLSSGKSYLDSLNPMMTNGVNITGDPYTLMYVTDVTHVFQEGGYYNYVEGCKFCENLKYNFDIKESPENIQNYNFDSTSDSDILSGNSNVGMA